MSELPPVANRHRATFLMGLVLIGLVQLGCLLGVIWVAHELIYFLINDNTNSTRVYVIKLVILTLVGIGCSVWNSIVAEYVAQIYVHEVREKLVAAMAHRKLVHPRSLGAHISRFERDFTALYNWVAHGVCRSISAVFLVLAVLLGLSMLDLRLVVLVVVGLVLVMLGAIALDCYLSQTSTKLFRLRGQLTNVINALVGRDATVVLDGQYEQKHRRISSKSWDLAKALCYRELGIGMLRALIELIAVCSVLGVLAIGVTALANRDIILADFAVAMMVVALLPGPLRNLGRATQYRQEFLVSRRILAKFHSLAQGSTSTRVAKIDHPLGVLKASNLTVGRLKVPDFTLRKGKKIALTGCRDRCKTNFLATVSGMRAPTLGQIFIDGVSSSELSDSVRTNMFGIAANLGNSTLDAVSYEVYPRLRGASEAELARVTRVVGLMPGSGALPPLTSFRLGYWGVGLTPSKKAQLKLAEALIGQPNVLLLDQIDRDLDDKAMGSLRLLIENYPGTVICALTTPGLIPCFEEVWEIEDEGEHLVVKTLGESRYLQSLLCD